MDRQVFNWTQTIYKKATKVFKNRKNLENVKNVEKNIKMAISQPYGLQTKIWENFLFFNFKHWRPYGWDMAIFLFLGCHRLTANKSIWPYLSHMASKWKSEVTFSSSTFIVEENKVPSEFHLEAIWLRYGHFLFLGCHKLTANKSKWPYFSCMASKWKSKDTFYPSPLISFRCHTAEMWPFFIFRLS